MSDDTTMSAPSTGKRRLWPTPRGTDGKQGSNKVRRATVAQAKKAGWGLQEAARTWTDAETVSPQLTLFAEAFPVNPTPWLADVAALQTNATSGRNLPESFARLDHGGCWRKMSAGYSQMMLDGSLEEYCETWPRAGTTRNGIAYRLPPSAPLTKGIASGLLPTPTAEEYGSSQNGINHTRPSAGTLSLSTRARRNLWPTPRAEYDSGRHRGNPDTLHSAVKTWPTPDASPHKYRLRGSSQQSESLNGIHGGQLNPTWVEWLMGYPLGWTACEAWETRSSRKSRNGSGAGSSRQTDV